MDLAKKPGGRLWRAATATGAIVMGLLVVTAQPASAHPDPSICNLRYEDHGSWFTCTIGPYQGYATAATVARGWDNTGHITNFLIEQSPAGFDMWNVMLWVNKH